MIRSINLTLQVIWIVPHQVTRLELDHVYFELDETPIPDVPRVPVVTREIWGAPAEILILDAIDSNHEATFIYLCISIVIAFSVLCIVPCHVGELIRTEARDVIGHGETVNAN